MVPALPMSKESLFLNLALGTGRPRRPVGDALLLLVMGTCSCLTTGRSVRWSWWKCTPSASCFISSYFPFSTHKVLSESYIWFWHLPDDWGLWHGPVGSPSVWATGLESRWWRWLWLWRSSVASYTYAQCWNSGHKRVKCYTLNASGYCPLLSQTQHHLEPIETCPSLGSVNSLLGLPLPAPLLVTGCAKLKTIRQSASRLSIILKYR